MKQDEISVPVYLVIVQKVVKQMIQKGIQVKGSRVLVIGPQTKEEHSKLSVENTVNLCKELQSYGIDVHCFAYYKETLLQENIKVINGEEDLQQRRLLSKDHRLIPTKACFDAIIWTVEKTKEVESYKTTPCVEWEY